MNRTVLALYSSTWNASPDQTLTHRFAEMPLNYLGLSVRYWDLKNGLPPEEKMKQYRGILIWSRDVPDQNSRSYARWLLRHARQGKQLVMIGRPGIVSPGRTGEQTLQSLKSSLFETIGLSRNMIPEDVTGRLTYNYVDENFMEFERSLPDIPPGYQSVQAMEEAEVHLSVTHKEHGRSDLVVTHPGGGFVSSGYALYEYEFSDRVSWHVNPFRFFRRAYGTGSLPKPNLCLLNGHRILTSCIDGDGFLSTSKVDHESSAGKMIYERILKRYSVPTAVSFIGAELHPDWEGSKQALQTARNISSLSHVEGASHTWSHPMNWQDGEVVYDNRNNFTYSMETEIDRSITYLNRHVFSKTNNSVRIYLWSGNALPGPDALRRLEKRGIPNMNGGLTRIDAHYPSVTSVKAFGRPVGSYVQVYAPAGSEFLYTEGWKKNFHAFQQVKKTWENTDQQRLLKPLHLYYHFYSGDRKAGLNTLHNLYNYLQNKTTSSIFPSRYARMVQDFYRARIFQEDGGYRLENWGAIRTITFRHQKTYPDLEKSEGVIGFRHRGKHTHLYLNDSDRYLVHLKDTPPRDPYIVGATGVVPTFRFSDGTGTVQVQGVGDVHVTVGGLTPNKAYQVGDQTISTDERGRLRIPFHLPDPGKRTKHFTAPK